MSSFGLTMNLTRGFTYNILCLCVRYSGKLQNGIAHCIHPMNWHRDSRPLLMEKKTRAPCHSIAMSMRSSSSQYSKSQTSNRETLTYITWSLDGCLVGMESSTKDLPTQAYMQCFMAPQQKHRVCKAPYTCHSSRQELNCKEY